MDKKPTHAKPTHPKPVEHTPKKPVKSTEHEKDRHVETAYGPDSKHR